MLKLTLYYRRAGTRDSRGQPTIFLSLPALSFLSSYHFLHANFYPGSLRIRLLAASLSSGTRNRAH
ncbi:hypothetical protein BJX66DRAFT_305680 [Aspergillus keveii]|uniref:Uncharacterized protein n=1 Tax=Aspergillus keveii TaxID=714993 RepID=A0ABR4G3P8_9EURO